ncbi:MAG: nucleotide exchange factor GrpE [Proteobacteria bacterium]|nr:nucleotide exchange factor GrpE [Pseudomonadota bacterium]
MAKKKQDTPKDVEAAADTEPAAAPGKEAAPEVDPAPAPAGDEAADDPAPAAPEAVDQDAPEAADQDTGPAAAEADPEARIGALEAEVADLKDKLLRALAEAENVRRRAERDKIEISKYAVAGFAREILPVADNLRRALDSIDQKTRQENETVETLVVGVELTERDMLNAFERIRITPIEAMGQKFDHNLHEAMFEIEDKDQPEGTVVQVLQTGYMLGERLLRPARVGVSKGGPKTAPEAEPAAEAAAEPAPKGPAAAYEKQAERHGDAAGSKVDEEL